MKIRMLVDIGGARNGQKYPPPGGIMELIERDDGHDLLDNGYAVLVEEPVRSAPVIETATVAPPEVAALTTKSFQPRKYK